MIVMMAMIWRDTPSETGSCNSCWEYPSKWRWSCNECRSYPFHLSSTYKSIQPGNYSKKLNFLFQVFLQPVLKIYKVNVWWKSINPRRNYWIFRKYFGTIKSECVVYIGQYFINLLGIVIGDIWRHCSRYQPKYCAALMELTDWNIHTEVCCTSCTA